MSDLIVLLHGAATGSLSWTPISASLTGSGPSVVAPGLIGYGRSPPPSRSYGIAEEVSHLMGMLDRPQKGTIHLVTHSLGSLIGLHLRRRSVSHQAKNRVTAWSLNVWQPLTLYERNLAWCRLHASG